MPSSVRRWPSASRGPPGPRHGATLQLRALEASEAIAQNMKKAPETSQNGTDQTPSLENGMDQARKLMESLAEFQKKAFGPAASDKPSAK